MPNLQKNNQALRLHLGCGERYLEGYINIDLPSSAHTVAQPKTDLVADFRTLQYDPGSNAEIRCHHVFEHFSRAEALKLLLQWRRWLRPGGVLHIETPDFDTCAWYYFFSGVKARAELTRHIFGSQEAGWAHHYDGWGKRKFRLTLTKLGFTIRAIKKRSNSLSVLSDLPLFNWIGLLIPSALYRQRGWNKLPNITVIAEKTPELIDERARVRELLSAYLVGTEGEPLLNVWLKDIF